MTTRETPFSLAHHYPTPRFHLNDGRILDWRIIRIIQTGVGAVAVVMMVFCICIRVSSKT